MLLKCRRAGGALVLGAREEHRAAGSGRYFLLQSRTLLLQPILVPIKLRWQSHLWIFSQLGLRGITICCLRSSMAYVANQCTLFEICGFRLVNQYCLQGLSYSELL